MATLVNERERSEVMSRKVTILEKDLTLQWTSGVKKKLLYVKVKKGKTMEAFANKLITKDNIYEISQLAIMKKGRTINLNVKVDRTTYKHSFSGNFDAPVFYIASEISKEEYDHIFK